MKSIFGSYKFEDKKWKDEVAKWAKEGRLGENIAITGESADVRQGGQKAVKNHLSPKLNGASDVIVFVGENTHNSKGVGYEIDFAKSQRMNIIPVRIPETKGGLPQKIRDEKEIAFDPNAIRRALRN